MAGKGTDHHIPNLNREVNFTSRLVCPLGKYLNQMKSLGQKPGTYWTDEMVEAEETGMDRSSELELQDMRNLLYLTVDPGNKTQDSLSCSKCL